MAAEKEDGAEKTEGVLGAVSGVVGSSCVAAPKRAGAADGGIAIAVGTEVAEKENGTSSEDEVGVRVPNAKGADMGSLSKAPKELVFEAEAREKALVVVAVNAARAFAGGGILEAKGPSLASDFTVESVASAVAAAPNVDEEVGAGVVKENAVEAGADENEETDDANDEEAEETN
jgi:hypothetical protein